MNQSPVISPYWKYELTNKKSVSFSPIPTDPTHLIVAMSSENGTETIGHVYIEFSDEDVKYACTNKNGRELFRPVSDFGIVENKFERYAHLLSLQRRMKLELKLHESLNKQLHNKKTNTMKTQQQNKTQEVSTNATLKKENQLLFIEYSKPTQEGHFITVGDKYKNIYARIHKVYNQDLGKYEYTAYDRNGKFISKSDKLWELKNEFAKNSKELLEEAHQRRIASKEQSQKAHEVNKSEEKKNEIPMEKIPKAKKVDKTAERKNDLKKVRKEKSIEKQNMKVIDKENKMVRGSDGKVITDEEFEQLLEREQELNNLRDYEDGDIGEMNLGR